MDVTLIVDLVKGARAGVAAAGTRRRTTRWSARPAPLEDAWRASQVGMIAWLGELYGLDRLDAYQLLTQISRSPLANVVRHQLQRRHQDREVVAAHRRAPTAACTATCASRPPLKGLL